MGRVQIATETERKYDVPADFELPSLIGAAGVRSAGDAETHDLDATYFDTDELQPDAEPPHAAPAYRRSRTRAGI